MNSPPCEGCGTETVNQGMGVANSSETAYGASRVELYRYGEKIMICFRSDSSNYRVVLEYELTFFVATVSCLIVLFLYFFTGPVARHVQESHVSRGIMIL